MDNPAPTELPIHDLLRRRWSPRAFSSRAVEPDTLRVLLEAARWAPSCFNEQPWRFLVATSADPGGLERMLGCLTEGNQAWAKAAPVLLLTVARTAFERNGKPNRHAYHDVGLAVANLTVQATALGLAVHQMAGIVPEKVRETYAMPEGFEPVTGVAVGHPGEASALPEPLRQREAAPRTRRPLGEIAFSGGWGRSAFGG